MAVSFKTPQELLVELGARVRAIRISRSKTQMDVAMKAGIGLRAVVWLENGKGSTLETFVRVLKALDSDDVIASLAPEPDISPVAMLKRPMPLRRVRHSRRS